MMGLKKPCLVTNADFDAINNYDHTVCCQSTQLNTYIFGDYAHLRPIFHELKTEGWEIAWTDADTICIIIHSLQATA